MLLGCKPVLIGVKCQNCKRLVANAKFYVNVKSSKDLACIYIPISLQVKS